MKAGPRKILNFKPVHSAKKIADLCSRTFYSCAQDKGASGLGAGPGAHVQFFAPISSKRLSKKNTRPVEILGGVRGMHPPRPLKD